MDDATTPASLTAVFEPDEVVLSQRIQLSRLHEPDFAAMSAWLAASLAPDWELHDLAGVLESGAGSLIIEAASGEAIGLFVTQLETPITGAACIAFVSIAPEHRYRGLGGEACLAFERHLRRRFGVDQIFAPVPDGRGLAVYFWLRLGYRPLTTAEAPWPLVGLRPEARPGIWLRRDAE